MNHVGLLVKSENQAQFQSRQEIGCQAMSGHQGCSEQFTAPDFPCESNTLGVWSASRLGAGHLIWKPGMAPRGTHRTTWYTVKQWKVIELD